MTGFTARQLAQLRRNVGNSVVRTKITAGREISYLEGWYVVAEANRIFGFDRWSRETLELRSVGSREIRGSFQAGYIAKVRVTVSTEGTTVIREAHGTGDARGTTALEAHDMALKTAETDATKRALATFGKPFGLALYRRKPNAFGQCVQQPPRVQPASEAPPNASLQPPLQIDEGSMRISKPKRIRDKAHLRFVGSEPCLLCGRQPADAHHVRYAQPQALGLKVSDEFVVPLCRTHHREAHQTGNERSWWQAQNIDPLDVARALWIKSRGRQAEAVGSR
jgi:hypothetical protein